MELYVHVGPHKTATTTLQHFFFRQRQSLAAKGLSYPVIRPGHPNQIAHNDLALAMKNGDDDLLGMYLRSILRQAIGAERVLISAEEFSDYLSNGMARGLGRMTAMLGQPRYIFVDRSDPGRFTSAILHNLAIGFEDVTSRESLQHYVDELAAFSREQRAFFAERGATFIDFDTIASSNIGYPFLQEAIGIDHDITAESKNSRENYTSRITAMSHEAGVRLASFLGRDDVAELVGFTQDPLKGQMLSSIVRQEVERSLCRAIR
ncbi:hypothetical protein [Mangrovicella endophytica]|uniref:hypothetical protein n=1 Tax=Mangrovicella endophytica TaxID=2066697 RepID=UPI000C9E4578|nr:hypothetical protein [Mangrovicella endophytica]